MNGLDWASLIVPALAGAWIGYLLARVSELKDDLKRARR